MSKFFLLFFKLRLLFLILNELLKNLEGQYSLYLVLTYSIW